MAHDRKAINGSDLQRLRDPGTHCALAALVEVDWPVPFWPLHGPSHQSTGELDMETPEQEPRIDFAAPAEPPAESPPEQASLRPSWVEVLVDPRTLQGLMSCGAGLLVLGLVAWLWAIGVFANKLVVASCLGAANVALLSGGLAGVRYSRYKMASKAITMLACLVMPLNLWFYDAQGIVTLDQGGHLWVPALVCCTLYVLVARLTADPWFVPAIVGGVTMTGLLILADQNVDRFWEIMAPSSFLVILGIACIHIERAFPPEEGRFSRSNFGRAFFYAGHVLMGVGLAVLFVGRVVGRLWEPYFINWEGLLLPEVATQANLKLMAIGLTLAATYTYVYSQVVVKAKGQYVVAALFSLGWSAVMLLDVLNVALTWELVMLLSSIGALAATWLAHTVPAAPSQDRLSNPVALLFEPIRLASGQIAGVLSTATLGIGLVSFARTRTNLFAFDGEGELGILFVVAALLGGVAFLLAALAKSCTSDETKTRWQLQASVVMLWLAVDGALVCLGIPVTIMALISQLLVAIALAAVALCTSSDRSRQYTALAAETLAGLILAVGVGGMLGLTEIAAQSVWHLGYALFFVAAAIGLALASHANGRLASAIVAAACLCAATWQGFQALGVTHYVFVLSATILGTVCLLLVALVRRGDAESSQFAIVGEWTGRLCITYAGAASLLIALARLLSSETSGPVLGLLATHVAAGAIAGALAKDSGWRRHFWVLATGEALMAILVVNALSAMSIWQRGEIFLTAGGLVVLAFGYLGWYRETDRQDDLVSFNLALGSFLSVVPLTLGMLVQRFDNKLADWGWVLVHEGGVLTIGLLLLGAGVLCRIRWSTLVGGSTLLVYVVSLLGMIHLPEKLQTTAIYMMAGGGLFFGLAVLLSIYRDRLLAMPERMQNGEGVFRVLKWR